jgi:hypothetical protein
MNNKFHFQQILPDGTKYGQYRGSQPSLIAKKMAREIYKNEEYTTKKLLDIEFCKNRVLSLGGDVLYKYRVTVEPLKNPIEKKIGDASFFEYYKIGVKNLSRKL